MSTRSLTRVFDEDNKELVCIYRQMDGYPDGMGADLDKICKGLRLVRGMSDTGIDQANGMGCLAAHIVAKLKMVCKPRGFPFDKHDDKVPYPEPGNVYLYPAGTEDCGEEYVYHVKTSSIRKKDSEEGYKNGKIILSCYAVKGGYGEELRHLIPLATNVEPGTLEEKALATQRLRERQDAAEMLTKDLKGKPWFMAVGVGADELLLMVKSKPPKNDLPVEIRDHKTYEEYKVKIRVIGKITPVAK